MFTTLWKLNPPFSKQKNGPYDHHLHHTQQVGLFWSAGLFRGSWTCQACHQHCSVSSILNWQLLPEECLEVRRELHKVDFRGVGGLGGWGVKNYIWYLDKPASLGNVFGSKKGSKSIEFVFAPMLCNAAVSVSQATRICRTQVGKILILDTGVEIMYLPSRNKSSCLGWNLANCEGEEQMISNMTNGQIRTISWNILFYQRPSDILVLPPPS